jgi:4-azaleucine resistance transporter AzlC
MFWTSLGSKYTSLVKPNLKEIILPTPRHPTLRGLLDTAPILPGVLPFGMIYGGAAVAAGLTPLKAQALSLTIFAGASQVAAVDLMARGAAWFTVLLAVLVINSRFVMYAASLAQKLPPQNNLKGLLTSYLLTDQAYAVTLARSDTEPEPRRLVPYYFGAALSLWTTWQIGTAAGILLGSIVPPSWQLEFSIPLMFLALLVPALKDKPCWVAAIVAGIVVLAGKGLPYNLGLIVGSAAGIAAGLLAERKRPADFPDNGEAS